MKLIVAATLLPLAAFVSAAAVQPSSTLDARDAPPSQPTTSEYGSLGPGVYAHHQDPSGKLYFVYLGNSGNQTGTKTKRDNPIPTVNNHPGATACPKYRSNPYPQDANKGPYGDWCEKPNSKVPWKCNFHGKTADPMDLQSSYTNMENILQQGYRITNHALSTTYGTAVAYICHFGDGIDYDADHFSWMMRQLDTQCSSGQGGGDYYDGIKYAVGRTSNVDRDNCAFRID